MWKVDGCLEGFSQIQKKRGRLGACDPGAGGVGQRHGPISRFYDPVVGDDPWLDVQPCDRDSEMSPPVSTRRPRARARKMRTQSRQASFRGGGVAEKPSEAGNRGVRKASTPSRVICAKSAKSTC